jgi:phenylpyruvate tautomerase PptA (4-oxalocrotonate tautomerase family)
MMPKVFISYPTGTFSKEALDALAEEITTAGLECEKLPDTPYVRSNVWVYAREYDAAKVYHGGKSGGTKVISLEANVVEGGLDADSRKEMIARFTSIVGKHVGIPPQERVPLYIVIRDVPPPSWGMFGKPITLEGLRNPPADAKPV